MTLVPAPFLLRITYPCIYHKAMPREDEERLLDLPADCRIDNFAAMDGRTSFGDVRLAWNEFGLAVQAEVKGKEQLPQGDATRPRTSDGLTLWVDTRDARTSHRASRHCHQFHLLPTGGGPDGDEPAFGQSKINRALQDAPQCNPRDVPFRSKRTNTGYIVEAFLPAGILTGFDPEQNPRLGFYYALRDTELGEEVLSVRAEFAYWEDPTLWSVLELARP